MMARRRAAEEALVTIWLMALAYTKLVLKPGLVRSVCNGLDQVDSGYQHLACTNRRSNGFTNKPLPRGKSTIAHDQLSF